MLTPLIQAATICLFLFLAGCATTAPTLRPMPSPPEASSFESAQAWFSYARMAEAQRVWQDEQASPFDHALAAFRLAQETSELSWSREAIRQFKTLHEANSDVYIQAYLGASHALAARNFPLRGWWMIIPGPGFIRLYHVQQAFHHLNTAIDTAPTEPISRLIRATTFTSMSKRFGGHDEGMSDYSLIHRWVQGEKPNPDHKAIVASSRYQEEFWLAYARALDRLEQSDKAMTYWKQLAQAPSNPHVATLAQWRLATGG